MKVSNTGTHIKCTQNMVIQPSQSQTNALAFLDEDGNWIHMDIATINSLFRVASAKNAPAVKNTVPLEHPAALKSPVANSNHPFDDHFKS